MEIVQQTDTKTKTKGEKKLKLGTEKAMEKSGGGIKNLFAKKKKLLVLSTMFLLLCVTGYLNFTMNNQRTIETGGGATTQANLFNTFRMTRADERARDIMIYENLMATSTNAETILNAEQKLMEIRTNVAFETSAEGLILAERYDDVIVNKSNGFVNVLIKRDQNIDRIQAIKIMSILQSIQPDLDIDNVFIAIME